MLLGILKKKRGGGESEKKQTRRKQSLNHLTQSCLRENTIITTYTGSDVLSQRLIQNVL